MIGISTLFSTPCQTFVIPIILILEPSVLVHMKLKNGFLLQVPPFRKFYHICIHDVSCLNVHLRWRDRSLMASDFNVGIVFDLLLHFVCSH